MMATTDDLELWSDSRFTSPWVLAVWATLQEKALPFALKVVDLERGEHRRGDYPRLTLTAKVPGLRHGDFWLAESLAIIEYLEETFPPPAHRALLAADPRRRARDRQLMCWIRSDFFALREALPFEGILSGAPPPSALSPAARAQVALLLQAASAVVPERSPATPTAADFDLAFMVRRLVHYRQDLSGHDDVAAHCEAIWSRPSVQSFVALQRPPRR
jgi:glutathione S-transferase